MTASLYAPTAPFRTEMLPVGDGQSLYVEQSGNPHGKPAVFLHGGPGGGTHPDQRRFWNPELYRIILFDQRGSGRSTPSAADGADLSVNTTPKLVADLEVIRAHLGIDSWQVFGGSWGSTLALAYAEAHPDRVTELLLRGIFLLRRWEIDWYYNRGGAQRIFPDQWERFEAQIPPAELDDDHVATYHRLLHDPDPRVAGAAAVAWTSWEEHTSTLHIPDVAPAARFALAFARIENHYFVNRGFLRDGQLLEDAGALQGIPGVIVQGRYDVVCPMQSAWDLHSVWKDADLLVSPASGHSVFEQENAAALVSATDRFAARS